MKLPNLKSLCAGTIAVLASISFSSGQIIAGWDTNGQTLYGTQNLAPSYSDPGIDVGGLNRGPGVTTTGGAAGNAWGGNGWTLAPGVAADAITAGDFITFSLTPQSGFTFSGTTLDLRYRRSGTGPSSALLQYQIGSGTFTDLATLDFPSTATSGESATANISSIQNVPAGQTVLFRLVPLGATQAGGTFYINGPAASNDLVINGTGGSVTTGAPIVIGRDPLDNSTNVPVVGVSKLTLTFSETVFGGAGNIVVRKVGEPNPVVTIDATNPDQLESGGGDGNEIKLVMSPSLQPSTSYYVEIPSGAIVDSDDVPFAGFSGTDAWNFSTADPAPNPTVVVNKFSNGTPERVELLVIKNGIPGEFLDMRGMFLKDFSGDNGVDNGGRYEFTTDEVWEQVPVGTLIVLSRASASTDIDPSDFLLNLGLDDATYFTPTGTFDIAASDMVAIKSPGQGPGVVGGIHALASGTVGTQFINFPGAKNFGSGLTGGGDGIIVNNATSTIADYNPISATGATSPVSLTLSNFGAPNNGTNAAYIASLRGLTPGDGDGTATLVNVTPSSPFFGVGIFDNGLTAQSAKVTILAQSPSVTVSNVTMVVPVELGAPSSVTLSGPGASGATFSLSNQTITISSASATATNALEVIINGLITPSPAVATDNGNYPLTVTTSASGGMLFPIATQPAVRVLIPIEFVRDVNSAGVPLDAGTIVAVEGVVTEENFNVDTSTSAFIQDSTAGINVFYSAGVVPLVRGNRYAAVGSLVQFSGLTEIVLAAPTDIVNLGSDTEPAPVIVTIAQLLADAESFEGSLVTIQNLGYVSGTWEASSTVVLADSIPTNIDIRIQAGSQATIAPTYPVNVTGIFGQFDGSSPFNSVYQLMPRNAADLTPGTAPTNTYASWIGGFNVGTQTAKTDDFDNDGLDNAVENYLGTNPSVYSPGPTLVSGTASSVTFRLTRSDTVATDLVPSYEWSTNLTTWTASGPGPGGLTVTIVTSVVTNGSPNDVIEVVSTVSGGTATRLFVRLKVL